VAAVNPMKPWENTHTIAVLWMLVGVLLVAIVAGKVSEHQADLQSYSGPVPVKHPVRKTCAGPTRGAWCP